MGAFQGLERLEKDSMVPLYRQLARSVEKRIQDGSFPEGSRIPSEQEWMRRFGLSRITVRQAMEDTLVDSASLLAELARDDLRSGQIERGTTLSMEDVRTLQTCLHQVDILSVRRPYLELIRHLRQAGIDISDRRAVKFQRLVAASALLCGRTTAGVGDFWILQHIWERQEQQEVLKALVHKALEADDGVQPRHPRAETAEAPDAEALARDLDWLAGAASEARDDPTSLAPLRDRLSMLAGRCQWVVDADQRSDLQQKVDALWVALGDRPQA